MSDDKMALVLDDGLPMVLLIEELNAMGLTISNAGGFRFRMHPIKSTEDVIARLQRRRDARTDEQIRAGMKHLRLIEPRLVVLPDPSGVA